MADGVEKLLRTQQLTRSKIKGKVKVKNKRYSDTSIQGVLGYIDGYQYDYLNNEIKANPDTAGQHLTSAKLDKQTLNPDINLTSNNTERKQSMPSYSEDTYKYGIEDENNSENWLEDPLLPGFELLFSSHNPHGGFFNGILGEGSQTAIDFLTKYGTNITNITLDQRIKLLNEFRRIFKKLFYISNNLDDVNYNPSKIKAHYIISLEGLDKLKEKIVKYKEDKITVTMNEDIGMTAMYLAELYNNLCYDYNNQRYLIPENCLRFDMAIKINDIRNMLYYSNINGDEFDINNSKSYMMYILRDCNFSFFNSQNHPATIDIGGFGSVSYNPVDVSFDIYYKSIEKVIAPYTRNLYDSSYVLDNKENVVQNGNPSKFDTWSNDTKDLQADEERKQRDLQRERGTSTLGVSSINDPTVQFAVKTQVLQKAKKFAISKLNEYRGELINLLLEDLKKHINIPTMYPENVYTTDVGEKSLQNFVKGLTSDTYNQIIKGAQYGGENIIGGALNNL